tara:strand:+ start:31 stop:3072 length:3042 start_codon:yes stop_codon:yes gene_type:complete
MVRHSKIKTEDGKMSNILGLDLGPNSIGWSIINTDRKEIIDAGVRIFPEGVENYGKGGQQESKNVARRVARGMRKQNNRYRMRRDYVRHILKDLKMFPSEKEAEKSFFKIDPYEVRKKGVKKKLSLLEFGTALIHLNSRRCFKSNRKTDSGDTTKIHKGGDGVLGISETEKAIKEGKFKTLGAYLASLNPGEIRRRSRYTKRKMYEDEFNILWDCQKRYHKNTLTNKNRVKLLNAIFFQRKLKSQKHTVAKCTFEPKKKCAPKSSPVFQYYRILEQLSRLRISTETRHSEPLTQDEKDKLIAELLKAESKSFTQISIILSLPKDTHYNLEHEKKLKGHSTFTRIRKAIGKDKFSQLNEDEKITLWHNIYFAEDTEWLEKYGEKIGLTEESAAKLAKVTLEKEYCNLSQKGMKKMIPHLEKAFDEYGEPMTYDKAVKLAGYHHSEVRDKTGSLMNLPNPENIRNPIVQQTLFELKKVVNALIDEYGNPECIKVELVRELKLPRKRREKIFRENLNRKHDHEEIRTKLIDLGIFEPSRDDVIKYKLWNECDRTDVYTGKKIQSVSQLFNGEYEVEHILPKSRSLDDSYMNKTLCHKTVNAEKGNQTPWETWGETSKYDDIIQRVEKLVKEGNFPYPKYKRFLTKQLKEEDFINRQLVDTAYIATEVRKYLWKICKDVQGVPGIATAKLRWFWGLDSILSLEENVKNREDHRHHAVDAIVVACTERKFIQKFSTYHHFNKDVKKENFPKPWVKFRADAEEVINRILVSHKIKNNVRGKLHKESYYGLVRDRNSEPKTDEKGQKLYAKSKPATRLTKAEIKKIPDKVVREVVEEWYSLKKDDRTEYPVLPDGTLVKRVRIHDVHSNVVEINPGVFVEPGSNHHMVIFENIKTGKRKGKVISLFEAAQRKRKKLPIVDKTPEEGWKFVMTLSINEMVIIHDNAEEIESKIDDLKWVNKHLYRVQKINATGRTFYRQHTVAILKDKENNEPGMQEGSPNKKRGRKVVINNLGKLEFLND